jgi:hypothetical protein
MSDQVIRPIVFDLHSRIEAHFKASEQMLEELRHHEDPRVKIAANAEMRHTLELGGRLLTIATQAEAMRDFQAAVLDALADAGVVVRRQVMGLFEARAAECDPADRPARKRKTRSQKPSETD